MAVAIAAAIAAKVVIAAGVVIAIGVAIATSAAMFVLADIAGELIAVLVTAVAAATAVTAVAATVVAAIAADVIATATRLTANCESDLRATARRFRLTSSRRAKTRLLLSSRRIVFARIPVRIASRILARFHHLRAEGRLLFHQHLV